MIVARRRHRSAPDGHRRTEHVLTRKGVVLFLRWYDSRSLQGYCHELEEWERLDNDNDTAYAPQA